MTELEISSTTINNRVNDIVYTIANLYTTTTAMGYVWLDTLKGNESPVVEGIPR